MLYGALLLTATGLLNQALGFVYRIFLSRLAGSEIMGLYQLVMPVYSVLLSVTAVGLTAAVSSLTSEYRALGNFTAAGQVLRRCLVLLAAPAGPSRPWQWSSSPTPSRSICWEMPEPSLDSCCCCPVSS